MTVEVSFPRKEINSEILQRFREKDHIVAEDEEFLQFLVKSSFAEKNPLAALESLLPLDSKKRALFLAIREFYRAAKATKSKLSLQDDLIRVLKGVRLFGDFPLRLSVIQGDTYWVDLSLLPEPDLSVNLVITGLITSAQAQQLIAGFLSDSSPSQRAQWYNQAKSDLEKAQMAIIPRKYSPMLDLVKLIRNLRVSFLL